MRDDGRGINGNGEKNQEEVQSEKEEQSKSGKNAGKNARKKANRKNRQKGRHNLVIDRDRRKKADSPKEKLEDRIAIEKLEDGFGAALQKRSETKYSNK
ncbi:hypothetical protein LTR36_002890 [Oleoguttula mirabilis]|uniref:Uncharacterized protein n=1 Tax=Oleoguttula mirabilis TaxID=1507867 RepID=A0AAV9JJY9_9PEZI|nr:hypothetical protein LTR36_002890 [Oleoguttula mirabilis]